MHASAWLRYETTFHIPPERWSRNYGCCDTPGRLKGRLGGRVRLELTWRADPPRTLPHGADQLSSGRSGTDGGGRCAARRRGHPRATSRQVTQVSSETRITFSSGLMPTRSLFKRCIRRNGDKIPGSATRG